MNAQELLETLRDEHETPLSRLGSSKWIYALTAGEMDADHVHAAAADEADVARRTFDSWAADEGNEDAIALFESVRDDAADHYETVAPDDHEPPENVPMYETLFGLEVTSARLGGLLARTLVTGKTVEQMVGFFVGDADPMTANTYRDLRSDVESSRDETLAVLDEVCATDEDWEAARTAADAVVEAAYDDYVETLESMGIKPKNVC